MRHKIVKAWNWFNWFVEELTFFLLPILVIIAIATLAVLMFKLITSDFCGV